MSPSSPGKTRITTIIYITSGSRGCEFTCNAAFESGVWVRIKYTFGLAFLSLSCTDEGVRVRVIPTMVYNKILPCASIGVGLRSILTPVLNGLEQYLAINTVRNRFPKAVSLIEEG